MFGWQNLLLQKEKKKTNLEPIYAILMIIFILK